MLLPILQVANVTLSCKWYEILMLHNPDWSAIFAPKGVFLREGELIRRTNYSRTLAAIASEGAGALYHVCYFIVRLLSIC